jgi:hypothetical protein
MSLQPAPSRGPADIPEVHLQIFKIASMYLCAGSSQCLGTRIGASQTEHLVTGPNQVPNHNRTDEFGGTRYENTHEISPSLSAG